MDSQVSTRMKSVSYCCALVGPYFPLSFVEAVLWGQCPPPIAEIVGAVAPPAPPLPPPMQYVYIHVHVVYHQNHVGVLYMYICTGALCAGPG